MKEYKDIDHDSNVCAYEFDDSSITVEFKDGGVYLYTHASAGSGNVERMKELAECGDGLNAFINKSVRKKYAKKLR